MLCLLLLASAAVARGQSHEVTQLLLNVEKLSQLKNILRDMKKGYTILSRGYEKIRDISQGNFSLHEVFLDGLMIVSPEIKKYHRVREIIEGQKQILRQCGTAAGRFRKGGNFSEEELTYLSRVYGQLLKESKQHLEELLLIVTSSNLRMSDGERIQAIDRIFFDIQEQLTFLQGFNGQVAILNLQRQREKANNRHLQDIYQLP